MKKKVGNILALLLFIPVIAICQSTPDSANQKTMTVFKLGVYHNTHLNYYGRTDSLRSSGVFPVAEIWIDNHFYITAAPVFVMNKATGFDYAGTVTATGYRWGKENKSVFNIYFVKPFYTKDSRLVQSVLKAQAAGSATWLNKVLNLTGSLEAKLSDKVDIGTSAGIDHIFRYEMKGPSVLVIDPSVYINAGSQQFTRSYMKYSSFLLFPPQEVTEEVKRFKILSYEFSMPVVYAKGKFQFICTPAYVLPQNLVVVKDRPDLSERGQNLFYTTVGAKYIF